MSGRARPAHRRAAKRVLVLGLLLLVAVPVIPASAAENRGVATQDGWWNRAQGPAEGEPDGNPVRPLVPALPKPPNVPTDAIAAGVTAGQVDKVAAVGIDVALTDGATLETLTLRLKENAAGGATFGADKAKVIACPATEPWGPTQNGNWRDRPPADCELGSAEGVRGDDGTWTFDLSALGRLWADPFAPLALHGVVLSLDPATAPSAAQVSWVNFESGGVSVALAASPGSPTPSGGASAFTPEPLAAAAPAPTAAQPSSEPSATTAFPGAGVASADSFASTARTSQPALDPATATDDPTPAGTEPEAPAEVSLAAPASAPGPIPQARPAVGFWERVPGPTALLVPVAVGLAVLIGVALGPGGRPAPVFVREGGLSRALTRRNAAGGDHA